MPTGYTHAVQDGKVTEFADFAMLYARAFGACVALRDSNGPIPERFEPDTRYHDESLARAETRLAELRGMSLPAIREAAQQEHAAKVKSSDEYAARMRGWRQRYEAMLLKVEAWQPPSSDHAQLKQFMSDQLRESISFDCSEPEKADMPAKLEPADWHAKELERAEWDRSYHTQKRAEEIARTEQRNRWLAQLRSSLAPATETSGA